MKAEATHLTDHSSHSSLAPGAVVAGRYEILDRLGRGGIGEVYRVADRELNNQVVALKVLRAELAADENTFQRFRNEVFVARGLVHPGIVRIFDIGKTADGFSFITMELVEGNSFKDLLDEGIFFGGAANQTVRQPRFGSFTELLTVFEQLLEGVGYAHSQGVIHRDLKPANVLLTPSNAVKLLDFGTARFVESDLHLTQSGHIVGTPLYMAPEQIRGEKLDARCDVYALGLIGYEIAVGKRPFPAEDVMSAMYHHLQQEVPQFASAESGIPRWFELVILRACSKNREDRFSDANEMLSAVRAKGAGPTGGRGVGLHRRMRISPFPASIAFLASAAAGVYFMLPHGDEPVPSGAKASAQSGAPTPIASISPAAKPSSIPPLPSPSSSATPVPTVQPEPSKLPTPSPERMQQKAPVIEVTPEPVPSKQPAAASAELSLRDEQSAIPSNEFEAKSIPNLRALAIVSDSSLLNMTPEQVAAASWFFLFRVGGGAAPIRSFPAKLLSEGSPGSDELRLGANFRTFSRVELPEGSYMLELRIESRPVGSVRFTVR